MQNVIRREFVKNTLVGAAALAVGAGISRGTLAAEVVPEVKFAKDPQNLQPGLETAHTPSISLEKIESKNVVFGKTAAGDFYRVSLQARHEATGEHHIFGMSVYVNGALLAEYAMNPAQPGASLPVLTLVQRLKSGDRLMAVTNCNLHGKWGNLATV